MKLAVALSERSDLQRRIAELGVRLENNARVQEGEKPAEDPKLLIEEMDSCLDELRDLVARINLTNSKTVSDGESITEMLARRDALSTRVKVMRSFLEKASHLTDRYSRSEIKVVSTVDVAEMRKTVDTDAKALRMLDEKLQELNWTTELL
jgi:hypothetical protein